MKETIVLISPGLNEGRDSVGRIISTIHIPNVEFVISRASQWGNHHERTVEPKIKRMKDEVFKLHKMNRNIILAGISASGSLVGNTALRCWEDISGVVIYSGRLKVGGNLFPFPPLWLTSAFRPAFADSVHKFEANEPQFTEEQRSRVLIYATKVLDELVPYSTATIPGAKIKELKTIGHTQSIRYALTKETQSLAEFIQFVLS